MLASGMRATSPSAAGITTQMASRTGFGLYTYSTLQPGKLGTGLFGSHDVALLRCHATVPHPRRSGKLTWWHLARHARPPTVDRILHPNCPIRSVPTIHALEDHALPLPAEERMLCAKCPIRSVPTMSFLIHRRRRLVRGGRPSGGHRRDAVDRLASELAVYRSPRASC